MPLNPQFIVNLEEIDSQHRYFIRLLDQIELATQAHAKETFPVLVEELLRYTKFHFASEEALMVNYGYPNTTHKVEHAELLSRVEAMLADKDIRPASLRMFLYNWIVNHIQLEDDALAKFIIQSRKNIEETISRQSRQTDR